MAAYNHGTRRELPRVREAILFLAVFFRVTQDGLSERGTNHSLNVIQVPRFPLQAVQ